MIRLQEISKLVFFVFVIILAVYVIFTNRTGPIENLEEFSQSQTSLIRTIYKDLYGTEPNHSEMSFYSQFFKGKAVTKLYIREIISSSAPSLKKVLATGSTNDDIQGTEQQVIAIYNQLLDRNPDAVELKYYSTLVKQGPQYLDTMKVQLIGSSEYQRLQKLQDNHANSGFLGGITDKQVEFIIRTLYKDILKKKQLPIGENEIDEETMTFLKKKYLEFEQKDGVFRQFLTDFVLFNPSTSVTGPAPPKPIIEQFSQKPSMTSSVPVPVCEEPINSKLPPVPCMDASYEHKPTLASLQSKRQRQELKCICERNAYFEDYHNE